MNIEHENDIVIDSYYLISLFNKNSKEITQLQLQKLMYFFEAYYMIEEDINKLYDCHFNAWMFGPVAIPLYKRFKEFDELPIVLSEKEEELGNSISKKKKMLLEEIYNVFGELTSAQLVNLTHMENSPWYKKWHENNCKIISGEKSYISKEETKDWFKKIFIKNENK